jgi:hypothetical protein
MDWAGNVERMGKKKNACRILLGKPEGKRRLRKPTYTWENNKMGVRKNWTR